MKDFVDVSSELTSLMSGKTTIKVEEVDEPIDDGGYTIIDRYLVLYFTDNSLLKLHYGDCGIWGWDLLFNERETK